MFASPDARYRAALRRAHRARRRYRYGRGMPWWVYAGGAAVALAALIHVGKVSRVLGITSSPPATTAAPSHEAAAAIAYARHQLGCPYVWAGTGPCSAGYDCSGLVMMAYQSAGVTIPRTSEAQWAGLHHVSSPHRGDLVFFAGSDGTTSNPGHVGLVLRPGWMIEAYATGFPIRISQYGPNGAQGDTNPVGFARPVPLAHHTVTLAAAGSYTPGSWARAFLRDGGYPVTSCNVGAVTAWQAAEGNWAAGNAGWRNPLNTTRLEPGSRGEVQTQTPGVWVQGYPNWAEGFTANLAALAGPDYGRIRAALAAGNNAQAVANAVGASVWGTQPFAASC